MKKDYSEFTEIDFIADAYFQQWVKSPDATNTVFWKQWLALHSEKRSDVVKAKAFIENLHFNTHLPSNKQVENSLARSLGKINSLDTGKVPSMIQSRIKYIWWAAAAIFFCLYCYYGSTITHTEAGNH